jgi:hypothetical protein
MPGLPASLSRNRDGWPCRDSPRCARIENPVNLPVLSIVRQRLFQRSHFKSLKVPVADIARHVPSGTNAIADFPRSLLQWFYSEAEGRAEIREAAAPSKLCRMFDT